MRIIKKICSFFLGSLMLVTGTNVLAGGGDKEDSKSLTSSERLPVINVAVVGDDDKGKKDFIKSYTRIQGQRYYGIQSYRFKYKGKIIKFFDIPSDLGEDSDDELEKKWINNFLKSSKKNRNVPYCTYVIICLNVETGEKRLLKRVYDWLEEIKSRNKDYQMQVVLYEITSENISKYYSKVNGVLSVLSRFEDKFMEQNPGVEQFRGYAGFPFGKLSILDMILQNSAIYADSISQTLTKSVFDISIVLKVFIVAGIVVSVYFGII